ncbi:hypothetical protein EPN87_00940 [archaeon]|nr:MAG: hypothetical protein EPN87_00940 [archaeon]
MPETGSTEFRIRYIKELADSFEKEIYHWVCILNDRDNLPIAEDMRIRERCSNILGTYLGMIYLPQGICSIFKSEVEDNRKKDIEEIRTELGKRYKKLREEYDETFTRKIGNG